MSHFIKKIYLDGDDVAGEYVKSIMENPSTANLFDQFYLHQCFQFLLDFGVEQ